ncbi:MAG: YhbY family RNA-binding protein [Verrucomicrobiota bacterium]
MKSTSPGPLSQKEKKALRGVAQRLKPTLQIGKNGVTESLVDELDQALSKDELVKARFPKDRDAMTEQIETLATRSNSHCVARVGFSATFYRPKQTNTNN